MNVTERENKKHSSALISYSYYKSVIPDYFQDVPMHWHNEFEINLILDGSGTFRCESCSANVKKGDIIIIQPNALHSVDSDTRLVYDTLVFSSDLLLSGNMDRCCEEIIYPLISGVNSIDFHISAENVSYGEISAVTANIMSYAKAPAAITDLLLKSDLFRLIWLLNESGAVSVKDESVGIGSSEMRRIVKFMSDNLSENITVDMLAEKAYLSKSYFMQLFKQKAGIGAAEYLNKLRIKRVCELLQTEDMNIADIAFECGFRNLSNFNRQFRKLLGCSPLEYKKRFR